MTDTVNVPEVGMEDAPDWYCHDSASGWACGWNACREYFLAAAPKAEPVSDPCKFAAWVEEMTAKHGNPNGTDYEQGQNDMGVRIASRLRSIIVHPEAPKVEQEPVANPLVFGLGALVVDHGKYGGEPAVFVAKAKSAGRVGELTGRDYFDRESLQPGELVLQFPTDTQAKSVADALVGSPAPSSELLEAADFLADRVADHEHSLEDDDFYGHVLPALARYRLAKHKGPQS